MAYVDGSLKGRLLVAAPMLRDPNFARSVVMVLAHEDDGALGVVLNRPSAVDLGEALPVWAPYASHPRCVFVGGPVAPGAAICLARASVSLGTQTWHAGSVGTLDIGRVPDEIAPHLEDLRAFCGYAGWSTGQLEAEVEQGAWFVVDAHPGDAFTDDPGQLWGAVLRRQGGRLALVATFPLDPRLN